MTALYIILVCYVPLLMLSPRIESLGVSALWLVFFAVVIAFFVYFTNKPTLSFLNTWLLIVVVFYIFYFASVSWSPYYSYDWLTLRELVRNGLAPLIIAVIALCLFRERAKVFVYMKHLCLCALILSLISIFQFLLGVSASQETLRAAGTFDNANSLAIFLVFCLPCLLFAMEQKLIPKALGLVTAVLLAGGVFSTVSRKGVVTMVIAFLLFYALKKNLKMVVLTLCLCIIGVAVAFSSASFSQRFSEKSFTRNLEDKANLREAGWQMFISKPVIGLGFNGYRENYRRFFPTERLREYDAHNMFVTELVDKGLVGFIPFLGIFLYPLIVSLKRIRRAGADTYSRDMAVICIATVIPFMMNGFFAGGQFYDFSSVFVLFTQIAIFLSSGGAPAAKKQRALS